MFAYQKKKKQTFNTLPQEFRKQQDGQGVNRNPIAMVALSCSPAHEIRKAQSPRGSQAHIWPLKK